jgi:plasmid stabilization system protein ParE
MSYRISRRANADLEVICDYIAKDNLDAADRFDERIHGTIEMLAQFPRMGHSRTDVSNKRYLFWTVGNYVIAYRVKGKQLIVVRVLHGARDFRKLFQASPS